MANVADTTALTARLAAALSACGSATAMRSKRYGLWQPISGQEALARTQSIARGLRAIGLRDGDVAAVVGDTCAEWVLADLGIMAAGGVSAGLDVHADGEELSRFVNAFGVTMLFVAGDTQLHNALGIRERCPNLHHIVVMHEQWDDGTGADHVMPLSTLEAQGHADQALPTRADNAIAAIILTSGITAPARGAQLTQAALGRQAARAAAALGLTGDDERLSLTPLHHVMERVVGVYASLLAGCIVNFPESHETAFSDLVELQPTVVQASPQLWARLKSGIELAAGEATKLQRGIVARSLVPSRDGAANALADAFVLAPIRKRIGLSRARLSITSGAPLRSDVAAWFAALGRPLTDVYGHAETGGAVTFAKHRGSRSTLEGITLDVAASGEIRVRSDALFAGYVGEQPRASDHWWQSGDVALISDAGVPHPAGRLDDLLDPNGRATPPFASEADLVASPYVADAFLHRDAAGRVVAAILMNSEAVVKYAQDKSIPFTHFLSLCRSEDIRALIASVVAQTNARAPHLRIDDFTLIERALGPGDPEVSATLALRRRLLRSDHQTTPRTDVSKSA
jgi:long-chain acyl-CoA synthetase